MFFAVEDEHAREQFDFVAEHVESESAGKESVALLFWNERDL
jgi:hypothetical protein